MSGAIAGLLSLLLIAGYSGTYRSDRGVPQGRGIVAAVAPRI